MNRVYFIELLLFLWVARISIFVRQRESGEFSSVDNYAMIQIVIVFFLLISFVVLYKRLTSQAIVGVVNSPLSWFFLLYVVGLLSSLWSPLFEYSAYKAFECLVLFIAICVYFKSATDFQEAEKFFIYLNLTLLFLVFFGYWNLVEFQFSLTALHTNSYSFIALILFLYSYGEILFAGNKTRERKRLLKKSMWIGLFFLAIGTSAASNVSAAIGIALLALFTNRNDVKFLFAFMVIFGVGFVSITGDLSIINEILFPGKDVEHISSMTGRVNLWEVYVGMFYQNPFLGWGFAVTSRISEFYATNTHNSFLSILTGMGLLGGFIFAVFLIKSAVSVIKKRRRRNVGALGSGAALIAALINSMAISVIGEGASPSTLSVVALMTFYFLIVAPSKYKSV